MARMVPWILSAMLAVAMAAIWVVMSGQLHDREAELQDLRQKYNQIVSEANQRIAELKKREGDLVNEANRKIKAESLKEAEVQVTFRKALVSSGNVAGFKNLSGSSISIVVHIERPASDKQKAYEITLDPNQNREVGEMEGWAFVSGDEVTVSQPNHKSVKVIAP